MLGTRNKDFISHFKHLTHSVAFLNYTMSVIDTERPVLQRGRILSSWDARYRDKARVGHRAHFMFSRYGVGSTWRVRTQKNHAATRTIWNLRDSTSFPFVLWRVHVGRYTYRRICLFWTSYTNRCTTVRKPWGRCMCFRWIKRYKLLLWGALWEVVKVILEGIRDVSYIAWMLYHQLIYAFSNICQERTY